MKLDRSIRTELAFVAAGLAAGTCLICVVFALLHRFDYTVLLGALWGSAFAFLSIFLLALRVQKVAESDDEEKKLAQKRLRTSYFGRMMLMVFAIVVGVIAPFFNYISALVPFLLPQPVLMLRRSIVTARAKRGAAAEQEQKEADPE